MTETAAVGEGGRGLQPRRLLSDISRSSDRRKKRGSIRSDPEPLGGASPPQPICPHVCPGSRRLARPTHILHVNPVGLIYLAIPLGRLEVSGQSAGQDVGAFLKPPSGNVTFPCPASDETCASN